MNNKYDELLMLNHCLMNLNNINSHIMSELDRGKWMFTDNERFYYTRIRVALIENDVVISNIISIIQNIIFLHKRADKKPR